MPPRVKTPCRFCPEPTQTLKPTPVPETMRLAITTPGEGERLWKHVLFGTSTCISMIEGYAALDMPGNPQAALVALRDRIDKVLSKYEEPHAINQSGSPPEHLPSGDEPASETLEG
jgi:hypothetical protein